MDVTYLSDILKKVSDNSMDVDTALESLKHLPYEDIGYANIDHTGTCGPVKRKLFLVRVRHRSRLQVSLHI